MAVVKSKLIPHLTPTNVMPWCWSSVAWKRQFPATAKIACNIDMEYLKSKYTPNPRLRYMPDFVGKRKRGRPKKDKGTKRKRSEDDDGLGLDDIEFGFRVDFDGEENVDGQEGEV